MNNEIEIGDYVRTKNGQIDIFEGTDENYMFARCKNKTYWKLDIVKHSKNIIDLIEVGDIVEWRTEDNSYYGINEVIMRFGTIGVYAEEFDNCIQLNEITIKSIVTKEQYKSVEYVF